MGDKHLIWRLPVHHHVTAIASQSLNRVKSAEALRNLREAGGRPPHLTRSPCCSHDLDWLDLNRVLVALCCPEKAGAQLFWILQQFFPLNIKN